MHKVNLEGCTATPFGNYLKALGVFRLVSEQVDAKARGWWNGTTFVLESDLNGDGLTGYFLDKYEPTPILAPWNGGSGFYPKDNKIGIDAIAGSTAERFALYREAIKICRSIPEVLEGKGEEEDERRTKVLRQCRNSFPDAAVEWLDSAVGIAADGSRSFAPVLGTGGNEGRLDYTNNFMSRIAALLIDGGSSVGDLLQNSLFGSRTSALQAGAAGQFDPGRAGGANQGQGIENDSTINPWDLIITMEGAVAWASGLYRRHGVSFRKVLCSPFTVGPSRVGYGSASEEDDSRGEIWMPLWSGRASYPEIKVLLREGRASVDGRAAKNGLEFAEAASSLGVDRGIHGFVRYSLLKRRGDSYVALPTGTFNTGYRSESDRVRQFQNYFAALCRRELPKGAADLRRSVENAIFNLLRYEGSHRLRELMRALGRMVRQIATKSDVRLPRSQMKANDWLDACGYETAEVRVAAALASIYSREVGPTLNNLLRSEKHFAWVGQDLTERMIRVLDRRLQSATALECLENPLGSCAAIHPGDATLFIERSLDEDAIEELMFSFVVLDWTGGCEIAGRKRKDYTGVIPAYAVLKHLFLPGKRKSDSEPNRLRADRRVISLLEANDLARATEIGVHRLKVAGLRPLDVKYSGGLDARRLAASLLIPVWAGKSLAYGIFKSEEIEVNEPELVR